ncbi:MAG: DegT/DnrJ/EryC1/StrS aminotransferase family protein [Agarilytica sp.]
MKSYSKWPEFSDCEGDLVREVLLSNRVNYWTGDKGKAFEKAFSEYVGTAHGIAVANGTLALELALRAVGVKAGDEVIVPARTFMATASAVAVLGAIPIFADLDIESQNISAETIAPLINNKTAAVICVHLAGMPCDMAPIMALAQKHSIKVIEDCAQAHGAMYQGKRVGSIGDVGAWSFCQDKIMTTGGEGGMITTNNKEYFDTMWSFKDHGKSFDTVYNKAHPPGFRWLHESVGSNYRMTEMQAALGLYQLSQLESWVARRAEIAHKIDAVLAEYPFIRRLKLPSQQRHAYYRCYAFWEHKAVMRDEFLSECKALGIPVDQGACPEVYLERAFENTASKPKQRLENAKQLGETSLMFLVHPNLSDDEVEDICCSLSTVLTKVNQ